MPVFTINSATDAADAYLGATTEEARDTAFQGVCEWLAAEYEADGYSGDEVDGMDLASAARDLIERRRAARR